MDYKNAKENMTYLFRNAFKIIYPFNQVNADDIFGSMVSADNACEIKCHDDSECSGLLKCCSTGCGTECIMPDFKGKDNNKFFSMSWLVVILFIKSNLI